MAEDEAGDTIEYTVTWLEMEVRPTTPPPPRPVNIPTALLRADDPPADYFLYLYREVGAGYEWTDWLDRPREDLERFIGTEGVSLHTLMVEGWPGGFFVLDASALGICDLAYFGLVPQAIGRGLGRWFLATAIEMAWEQPGVERLTVNTNTLDHPRALPLYQRMGFSPVRQEVRTRRRSQSDAP